MGLDLCLNQGQLIFSLFPLLYPDVTQQFFDPVHHHIEAGGEYPDFIAGIDLQVLVQIALIHMLHMTGQIDNRLGNQIG
ncbi:hypothetical protein D3C74_416140 [compost metagenome]